MSECPKYKNERHCDVCSAGCEDREGDWVGELKGIWSVMTVQDWTEIKKRDYVIDFFYQKEREIKEEEGASVRLLWKRLDEWQKEWQAENPEERALIWQDAKRLIEWKIERAREEGYEEGWEEGFIEG